MSVRCTLQIAPTEQGFVICVQGRGRIVESLAIRELAAKVLSDSNRHLVIDLNECDYLDSTNLGSLLRLHRQYGGDHHGRPRVAFIAAPEQRRRLFGATRLDEFLEFVDQRPPLSEEFTTLPIERKDDRTYGLHALEAHRLLGQHPCDDAPAFQKVAQQLEDEIGSRDADSSST